MATLRNPILAGCAAVAALAAEGAPALADGSGGRVRIEGDRVVVEARGASAVVDRSPFRISFRDASGRTLLSQVPNSRQSALGLPETLDPEPFALERLPDNATYAPLGFEIGREERFQWNGGLWGGNMLFSRRSGTVLSAHDVVSARRSGRGVRLLVSTGEPERRLVVKIAPDHGAALRVRVRPTAKRGVITMGDSFVAAPDEGFYGFGGRHGTVDKHGEKLYGWTEQESLGGEPTLRAAPLLPQLVLDGSDFTIDQLGGVPRVPDELPGGFERYLAVGGPNAAYYPQAQFLSSRGYGFLLNRTELSRWRIGNDRPNAWQVQVAGSKLDYSVILGSSRERALRTLTDITGRHRLPPRWAQGPTLSRAVSVPLLPGLPPAETRESYRAKVEQDLADIERFDVKLSAYAFEGWALLQDLDYVKTVIRRLRARGIRTILYHRAYVSNDALNTQPATDFEETMRLGLVAKDASGNPYIYGANGGGPATLLDFTNPETVRWWRERLELLLDAGADGFMQDFGEQVQEGMHFHDGSTGVTMHNRYPVIFHRVSRRIVDDWARRNDREPPWFFTRSGYSGRPGSAAYEMANFPGDETVDWSAGSGLRSLGPDMLNRAVGGAFGFTTDIGGYADFVTGAPSEELFSRWSEWAALTPYFRVHNSATRGTRMPWSYGPETLANWKALAALHERAIPYMRELWREGRRTGLPPTRPLWLAAPEAPGARGESQEWLLGEDVLVAPVVEQGGETRTVSFPRGCWRRQGGEGGSYHGPGRATVSAPLGTLPYFFRCGTRPF
jgi:alpha-glucosidase